MMKLAMSAAAAGLLRALLNRTGVNRDRILLIEFVSTNWNSLTFDGECHRISLRIPAPDAEGTLDLLTRGLADADLTIAGHFVADIAIAGSPARTSDGSILLELEALTVAA
jgi:hypothetical protein